jgi:hypothetical protein
MSEVVMRSIYLVTLSHCERSQFEGKGAFTEAVAAFAIKDIFGRLRPKSSPL